MSRAEWSASAYAATRFRPVSVTYSTSSSGWNGVPASDHATPCAARTHTSEPVPYLLFDRDEPGPGGEYSERGVAGATPVPAHDLMARLLR